MIADPPLTKTKIFKFVFEKLPKLRAPEEKAHITDPRGSPRASEGSNTLPPPPSDYNSLVIYTLGRPIPSKKVYIDM